MAYMDWSSLFGIGVPIFDDEHKKLIGMINALHDAIVAGTHAVVLKKIEDDLIEYTIVHFQHEEMFFEDYIYPGAEAHVAQHARMKRRILAYREDVARNPSAELCAEMLRTLREWLASHILTEDKKFGAFLTAHGHGEAKGPLPPR